MNELVERLTTEAGITPEQAQKAIESIANFVKEKFPMLGGAVDQIFTAGNQN
jgi:nucleoid DNA-binding protein